MGFHSCQCLEHVQDHPVLLAFAQLVPAVPSVIWKLWLDPETFRVLLGEGRSDLGPSLLKGWQCLPVEELSCPTQGEQGQ